MLENIFFHVSPVGKFLHFPVVFVFPKGQGGEGGRRGGRKAGREEGGEGGRRAIISNSEDISVFLLIYPRDKFHWLIFSLVLVI